MMIVIPVLFLCFYGVLLGMITTGWYRKESTISGASLHDTKVSVIVAVRNEEKQIGQIVQYLLDQDYPSDLLEIIFVDDHSSDCTLELVRTYCDQEGAGVRVIELTESGGSGKKAAIDTGIRQASGELILCTDADCRILPSWVSSMVSYYEKNCPVMLLGPVRFRTGANLFEALQELEFMSLMATTAGSSMAGFPLLANGANLAYSRKAYLESGGLTGNAGFPSGDDVFMMLRFRKLFGSSSIRFIKSAETIVTTSPEINLRGFINQRLRWVSKSRGYRDIGVITASIIVFSTNLLLLTLMIGSFFSSWAFQILLTCFLLKILIDLPVMVGISDFLSRRKLLFLFPLLEVLNIPYTVLIGVFGNLLHFTWRGRKFPVN